jgi:hypothetical protein
MIRSPETLCSFSQFGQTMLTVAVEPTGASVSALTLIPHPAQGHLVMAVIIRERMLFQTLDQTNP